MSSQESYFLLKNSLVFASLEERSPPTEIPPELKERIVQAACELHRLRLLLRAMCN